MTEEKKGFSTRAKASAVAALAAVASVPAHATGTTIIGAGDYGAAFTELMSAAGAMISDAWPVLIAITGGFILMKLGKRAMRSAT